MYIALLFTFMFFVFAVHHEFLSVTFIRQSQWAGLTSFSKHVGFPYISLYTLSTLHTIPHICC